METSVPQPAPFFGYPISKPKWGGDVTELRKFFDHAAKIFAFTSAQEDVLLAEKIAGSVIGFPAGDWLTGVSKEDSFIAALTGSSTGEQLITSTLKAAETFEELKANVYDKVGGENMDRFRDILRSSGSSGDYNSIVLFPLIEAYNGIGAVTGHLEQNKTLMSNYIDGLQPQGLTDLAHKLGIIVNKADGTIDEDKTKKAMKKAIDDNSSKLASFKAFNDNKLKRAKTQQTVRAITPAVGMVVASIDGLKKNQAQWQRYTSAKEEAAQSERADKLAEAKAAAIRAKANQPKKKEGVK